MRDRTDLNGVFTGSGPVPSPAPCGSVFAAILLVVVLIPAWPARASGSLEEQQARAALRRIADEVRAAVLTQDPGRLMKLIHETGVPCGDAMMPLIDMQIRLGTLLRVVEGLRTEAKQAEYYAQGRTAPGDIVTNAKPGETYHEYGLAGDVAGLNANGSINWHIDYAAIAARAQTYGFSWGGYFVSIVDRPHFEITYGLTPSQLNQLRSPGSPYPNLGP